MSEYHSRAAHEIPSFIVSEASSKRNEERNAGEGSKFPRHEQETEVIAPLGEQSFPIQNENDAGEQAKRRPK
jgi:hypothetical protein